MSLLNIITLQTQVNNSAIDNGGALAGWLLALLGAALVVVYVAQPLLKLETGKKNTGTRQVSDAVLELEVLQEKATAERKALYELEFDKELGILTDQDYDILKEKTGTRLDIFERAISERKEEIAETEREKKEQITGQRKVQKSQITGRISTDKIIDERARNESTQAPTPKTPPPLPVSERITGEFKLKPAVREALKCSECSTSFKPGETFCSQCKAPLPFICLNCGAEMDSEAQFCSRCGTAVAR